MERRGGRDETAAAHAGVLADDAKFRDARWQSAAAGDVLLREATNMRPRGTNRDGGTMIYFMVAKLPLVHQSRESETGTMAIAIAA